MSEGIRIRIHSYDAGDRLTDSGVSYDDFGRELSLPASDSGGGPLSMSYFADDMARSVSQEGISQTSSTLPVART